MNAYDSCIWFKDIQQYTQIKRGVEGLISKVKIVLDKFFVVFHHKNSLMFVMNSLALSLIKMH